jgi:predicted Zn-dependent peptidase
MYKDDPDDSLTDEFDTVVFKRHPMGMNILGNPQTVQNFKRSDFKKFLKENLRTNRIVFSVVGNIDQSRVEKLARKYLEVPAYVANPKRKKVTTTKAIEKIIRRQVNQSRAMLGGLSYSIHDKNRIPFSLLVNILGGPAMNSRLNSVLREKHGLVYSVEAHNYTFTDTGLFSIYFGTEPNKLDRCFSLVKREMIKMCETPLTPMQLSRAKEQMKGQLAFSEENKLNVMLMMGRAILDIGTVPTIEEVFSKIDAIDATKILDLSNQMFTSRKLNYLVMLPEN